MITPRVPKTSTAFLRVFSVALLAALITCAAGCGSGSSRDDEHTGHDHAGDEDATTDFCEEHQIAESQCPFCNPGLIESLGYCNGHDVPEAFCYQCNPNLIPAFKAVGDWCAGHDRPESQCYICNPELDPARSRTPAAQTSDATSAPGGADSTPSSHIPRTQQPPSTYCSTQNLIVRFESPSVAQDVGFQFATVESRSIARTAECNAEITYDGDRYAHLGAQVPGTIAEVHVDLGDRVEPGQALATITSAHLGAAKASFLQAEAAVALWERNHAREADLLERGVSTEGDLLEAETRLAESQATASAARQALISLGLSEGRIAEVHRTKNTSARYTVNASLPGVVVDRHAVVGEFVDSSKPLFAVADVARMWALVNVYESDLRDVRAGQFVVLHVEGLPGESFGGQITWVSSQLDPQTRTLRVRAELDNEEGRLRANMFARATILLRHHTPSLVVPASSVQWEGCCNVVFVKQSDTVFVPRKVHLGIATGTVYEVLSGISAGEEVVTQGSFLLKTEILKGSIGAGCCEVNPGT